jgi:KipI family sensor histidine kinase inhibitor
MMDGSEVGGNGKADHCGKAGATATVEGQMRVRAVGADALLLEVDDPAAWFAELCRRRDGGELTAVDIVPGARTVLLDGLPDATTAAETIRTWTAQPAPAAEGETIRIPVIFDGPDIDDVGRLWGVAPGEVAHRLTQTPLHVAFCGFAPGFAYLAGLPAELAVPRLETPRAKVPPGSVGLADAFAGIYPTASPGGWRLVGRTDVTLFDPRRSPPSLLSPGAQVRFVAVDSPVDPSTVDDAAPELAS